MSIRTTVIGSYPKVIESNVDNLPGAIDRWQRQLLTDDQLKAELEKVTRRVIQEQEEAGIDVISDGQIRWEDLPHPIVKGSAGIRRGTLRRFFDNNVYYRRLELEDGVCWQKSSAAEEFKLASQAAKKPVKVALPGPLTLVTSTEPKEEQSREKLLALFADLIRKEVEELEKAGVKEIQIDEPALSPNEPLAAQTVAAINKIFQGITPPFGTGSGVKARKWVATYFQDTSALVPTLLKLQVDVLALDLVSAREKVKDLVAKTAAGFAGGAWKGELALGLVDARNTKLEDPQELKRQRDLFLKGVPAERLWITPNCGLEFLPHASAVKKLKLLKQAAS